VSRRLDRRPRARFDFGSRPVAAGSSFSLTAPSPVSLPKSPRFEPKPQAEPREPSPDASSPAPVPLAARRDFTTQIPLHIRQSLPPMDDDPPPPIDFPPPPPDSDSPVGDFPPEPDSPPEDFPPPFPGDDSSDEPVTKPKPVPKAKPKPKPKAKREAVDSSERAKLDQSIAMGRAKRPNGKRMKYSNGEEVDALLNELGFRIDGSVAEVTEPRRERKRAGRAPGIEVLPCRAVPGTREESLVKFTGLTNAVARSNEMFIDEEQSVTFRAVRDRIVLTVYAGQAELIAMQKKWVISDGGTIYIGRGQECTITNRSRVNRVQLFQIAV
jgi:hypothetical protein